MAVSTESESSSLEVRFDGGDPKLWFEARSRWFSFEGRKLRGLDFGERSFRTDSALAASIS